MEAGHNVSALAYTQADERYDRELTAARDTFPAWDIHEVHGGLIAVPCGTETVSSITLDDLVRKLRERG